MAHCSANSAVPAPNEAPINSQTLASDCVGFFFSFGRVAELLATALGFAADATGAAANRGRLSTDETSVSIGAPSTAASSSPASAGVSCAPVLAGGVSLFVPVDFAGFSDEAGFLSAALSSPALSGEATLAGEDVPSE